MPNLADQNNADILNTYRDIRNKMFGKINQAHVDDMVRDYFGGNDFPQEIEKKLCDMNEMHGRSTMYTMIVLAKKKALDRLQRPYTLESLVNITNPADNPEDIKEEVKEILTDVFRDPELEQKQGESEADYRKRVKFEKNRRFNEEFYRPEAESLIQVLEEDMEENSALSEDRLIEHLLPFQVLYDGLFDTYYQRFRPQSEAYHYPQNEVQYASESIRTTGEYMNTIVDRNERFKEVYDAIADNRQVPDDCLPQILARTYVAGTVKDHLASHLEECKNASVDQINAAGEAFHGNLTAGKSYLMPLELTRYSLLSRLTDKERIAFALDPQIQRELEFRPVSIPTRGGEIPAVKVFFHGIDLQVDKRANAVDTEHLEELSHAISDSYNFHYVSRRIDSCTDLSSRSMQYISDAMQLVEQNLRGNSKLFHSSGAYRDMQNSLKDFRRYAEQLSGKNAPVTLEEGQKLTEYLSKAYWMTQTYLEKKDALGDRKNFKNTYEHDRVAGAKRLSALLRKTEATLNRAIDATVRKRQYTEYQRKARIGLERAERNLPNGWQLTDDQKKEFLSIERMDRCLLAREKMEALKAKNPGKTIPLTEETRLATERIAFLPLEYLSADEMDALKQNLIYYGEGSTRLNSRDIKEYDSSVQILKAQRRREREAEIRKDEKHAAGGSIFLQDDDEIPSDNNIINTNSHVDEPEDENIISTDTYGDDRFRASQKKLEDEIHAYRENMYDATGKKDPQKTGYEYFLLQVRAARDRLYGAMAVKKPYRGFVRDMKILELYAESKHEDAVHSAQNINRKMHENRELGQEDALRIIVDGAVMNPSFNKLMAEATSDQNSSMKAIRSFLFKDGAEAVYQLGTGSVAQKATGTGSLAHNEPPQKSLI